MQHHPGSEYSLAVVSIAIGFGKLTEVLVRAQPILASLSYIVAIIAGAVTVYFKLRNKN